jgi:thiol-disulfide isomerase/thioredoxin
MFSVLLTLAAGYLRASPNATNAAPAAWPDHVCNMANAPADTDNIADMEDMPVHDFVKAKKLVNTNPKLAKMVATDPKLAKLEAAQGKLEEAATAYKAAEAEMMVAVEDMLETPSMNQQQLAEQMAKKDKDLLVVFYAPWCGHCQRFVLHDGSGNPSNAPLEKINKDLSGDKLQVVRFDITASESPPDMLVEFIPTVYLAKKDGSKHKFNGDLSAPGALENFYKSI